MSSSRSPSSLMSMNSSSTSPATPPQSWQRGSLFSPKFEESAPRRCSPPSLNLTASGPLAAQLADVISEDSPRFVNWGKVQPPNVQHEKVLLDLLAGKIGQKNGSTATASMSSSTAASSGSGNEPKLKLDDETLRDLRSDLEMMRVSSRKDEGRPAFSHSVNAKPIMSAQSTPSNCSNRLPSPTCRITDAERERLKAEQRLIDKVKTVLCTQYMQLGRCDYGNSCRFAHGYSELRLRKVPANYKTVLCQNFERDGFCRYGKRCQFIHRSPSQRLGRDNAEAAEHARTEAMAPPSKFGSSHSSTRAGMASPRHHAAPFRRSMFSM